MVATMMAATKGGGQYLTPGPIDVCKTPTPAGPVPIPYPNLAMLTSAVKTIKKVKIVKKDAVAQGSKVPMSSLDNPGVVGGVKSGVNMNQVKPTMFSSKVYAKGKKVSFCFAMSAHNGSNANTVGMQVSPSQTKVWVSV